MGLRPRMVMAGSLKLGAIARPWRGNIGVVALNCDRVSTPVRERMFLW